MKFIFIALTLFCFNENAHALNSIIRPFESVRAVGMGNVRYSTGLYEENFYANPARVTANPENMFQFPKITLEAGSNAISTASDLTKSTGGSLAPFANAVGKPLSAKFQMIFPAYYNRHFLADFWAIGIGFMFNAQTLASINQVGNIDPTTVFTAGPAFTLGRRLLEENRLSVGTTIHTEFRGSINKQLSVTDFLSGTSLSGSSLGGNGMGVDLDAGTTYKPRWKMLGAEYQLAFAINNMLGGLYRNLGRPIKSWASDPVPTYRSFNFGVSGNKKSVWVFDELLAALEFTDIGNNRNGSMFKTIHLGTEAKWHALAARLGINQGYLAAGFGLDIGFFALNLATYGEEVGLNAGTLEDRRYALDIGFQI